MILLHRLNGFPFYLNPDLIEQVESAPDTVITLTTGNNFIVRDSLEDVIGLIHDYRKEIMEKAAAKSVNV